MTAYIALIRKQPDSDYEVNFSDFPGCVTAGRSPDETRSMAVEALALHVESIVEDRGAIPEPSAERLGRCGILDVLDVLFRRY